MVFKNGEKISQNGTAIISEKYNINTTASYLVKTDNKFKNRLNSTEINQINILESNNFYLFFVSRYSPNNADTKIIKIGKGKKLYSNII